MVATNVFGSDTLVNGFTYHNGPAIDDVNPAHGGISGGLSAIISGSGYTNTADNTRLAAILQQTMTARVLSQAFTRYEIDAYRRSLNQHATILDAIEAGDSEWASNAMRTHILSGRHAGRIDEADVERDAPAA